jgi:uncharacterized SAM-binding protein YcdF (DUF218 family)
MSYTEPLLFCVMGLWVAGLIRARHGKSRLLWLGLGSLLLVSWPPVDWLLSRPSELWYPARPFSATVQPQAIVALAASVDPPHPARPFAQLGPDAYERCEYALWLYRNYRLPILVSGGRVAGSQITHADVMRDHLLRSGVPMSMVWTEDRSTNTHESAVLATGILRARGISRVALVVEAMSMTRAEKCFRKLGIDVVPAVSGHRVWGRFERELLPSWQSVRRNEIMLHEALGLFWYGLRGWI